MKLSELLEKNNFFNLKFTFALIFVENILQIIEKIGKSQALFETTWQNFKKMAQENFKQGFSMTLKHKYEKFNEICKRRRMPSEPPKLAGLT